jgi:fluoroquinolone transport system permease protein
MNDIRYQVKYGFYLVYALISTLYIVALLFCPLEYRKIAASIIILTDPALLGTFFIGGIWLLEKREGLHKFWIISPLRSLEYIMSKAVSLSIISTLVAGLIALIGVREAVNYLLLLVGVFLGSVVFTVIGLILATYARSVNQYMIIVTIPTTLLVTPAILTAFGISHIIFDILPGTAMWRLIAVSLDIDTTSVLWIYSVLILWLVAVFYLACKSIPTAMQVEGGGE